MSISERNENALSYIERCERRRKRNARRRHRKIAGFLRYVTPFAAGICAIGFLLALVW